LAAYAGAIAVNKHPFFHLIGYVNGLEASDLMVSASTNLIFRELIQRLGPNSMKRQGIDYRTSSKPPTNMRSTFRNAPPWATMMAA